MKFTDERKPPENNEWEKKGILNNSSEKKILEPFLSVPQTKNQTFYFDKQSSFMPKKNLLDTLQRKAYLNNWQNRKLINQFPKYYWTDRWRLLFRLMLHIWSKDWHSTSSKNDINLKKRHSHNSRLDFTEWNYNAIFWNFYFNRI